MPTIGYSTMSRLNNLTLMSMEYELLRKLEIFAIMKYFCSKIHVNITRRVYIVEFICYAIYAATVSINSCNIDDLYNYNINCLRN